MIDSIPTSRSKRWTLARELANKLFAKRKPTSNFRPDVVSNAEKNRGGKFPKSVNEWYALIDGIGDYWSGLDRVWSPENAESEDGYCILMIENQGCFRMGHLARDDEKTDPPVYRFNDGDYRLSPSVSIFAIQMLLMESTLNGKHSFFDVGGLDNKIAKTIERQFRKSQIPDFPLWFGPTRFLCKPDVVIRLDYPDGLRGDAFVGFASTSKRSFADTIQLLSELGVDPEH